MMADFTIRNDSDYDVKDLRIRCEHYAPSGTYIDSNTRTAFEVVRAHRTRTLKNFNMGFIHTQAHSSACRLTDLALAFYAGPDKTSASVERAQVLLNFLGYEAGPADGVVGPRTKAAIAKFQSDHGLKADGKISEALIKALSAARDQKHNKG